MEDFKSEDSKAMNATLDSPVLEFYNGAKVLITGATGFLGKALAEKLLRVCTNIDHIYLLVRGKKGKDAQTRFKELLSDPIFSTLHRTQPDFEKKVSYIVGDCSFVKLMMSDSDYEFLTGVVTHVFHSAATVRFNEKIKSAIQINVYGTLEIVRFCKKCSNLKALVHVSTAYSNAPNRITTESYFEPPLTGKGALNLVEVLSEEKLNSISNELLSPWPNSYSFSKAIAENIVKDEAENLPTAIFRPGIIVGTLREPIQGWVDNIYGPIGVSVAVGVGLMRVLLADQSLSANLVPVDLTVNALICCAWEVGSSFNNNAIRENSLDKSKELTENNKKTETLPKIYNFILREENAVTWGEFLKMNLKHAIEMPTNRAIWYYTMTLTKIRFLYYVFITFFHFLPAILIDSALVVIGKKPQMMKAYKKIHTFTDVLSVFALQKWTFTNNNVQSLWNSLHEKDKKLFNFDMTHINWDLYFYDTVRGIRIYILKESEVSLPAARRKMFILGLAHKCLRICFIVFCLWIVSKLYFALLGSTSNSIEQSVVMKSLPRNSS